jgi:hypothetical protein
MPFFSLPPSGQITPEWFKALRLQLDRDDDEKEQKVRMAVERRFEREMRTALNDMLNTLFPEGYGEFVNPQIEANRIHEAFLRDQKMRDTVSRAIQDSADLGVSVVIDQLNNIGMAFDWTLVSVDAREWALAHTDTLLNQLGTTSGKVVGQAVGRWAGNGEPLQSLINDLSPAFGPKRAALVASTEVTRAYSEGAIRGYQGSGLIERRPQLVPPVDSHPGCRCWLTLGLNKKNEAYYIWNTSNDEIVCKICAPYNQKHV